MLKQHFFYPKKHRPKPFAGSRSLWDLNLSRCLGEFLKPSPVFSVHMLGAWTCFTNQSCLETWGIKLQQLSNKGTNLETWLEFHGNPDTVCFSEQFSLGHRCPHMLFWITEPPSSCPNNFKKKGWKSDLFDNLGSFWVVFLKINICD